MQFEILLALLIPSVILSVIANVRRKRSALARQLKAEWGGAKPAYVPDADAMHALAVCYREMGAGEAREAWVDGITWSDLDMDVVFRYLNRTQSGVGEEALYRMLHAVDADDETLQRRSRWMQALTADATGRAALQKSLRVLTRDHDHGAFAWLQNPQAARPAHAWIYFALAAAPVVFIGLGFVNPLWLLGIAASLLINAITYYQTKQVWMRELTAIRHLGAVLRCARSLRKTPVAGMEDGFAELTRLCGVLRPLSRWNGLLYMQRVNDLDFITDYLRIALQLDMISLIRLSGFAKNHAQDVRQLYGLVGEIDACIAVASVRKSLDCFAQPEFVTEKRVLAEDVWHPLIKDPVVNTLDWRQNVLITGSNASGKSTFVKSVALNAVLAQSIVTCFARRFVLPRAQVMSSMALRDNVQGGESYFIVEIKSLKRILSALRPDVPTLCFIDEILRGTNTAERIAASTALLSYLQEQNALCIAATHDMELTRLLPEYRQVHFREEITPHGMAFPYTLFEGVSRTRNAIRLLEQMGFPAEVIAAADGMAETEPGAEPAKEPQAETKERAETQAEINTQTETKPQPEPEPVMEPQTGTEPEAGTKNEHE